MSTDRTNRLAAKEGSFTLRLPSCRRRLSQAGEPLHLGSRTMDVVVALVEGAGAAPGAETAEKTLERAHAQARAIVEARQALIAELEQRCRMAAAAVAIPPGGKDEYSPPTALQYRTVSERLRS